jgi:3-oxoacyl-[acyl-carrier-protein] synthase III
VSGSAIAGVGHAVPGTVVANAPIAGRLGVDEHWIQRRTGTRERHVVGPGERLAELAARAAAIGACSSSAPTRSAATWTSPSGSDLIRLAGLTLADVDLLVSHQANSRILRAVGERGAG